MHSARQPEFMHERINLQDSNMRNNRDVLERKRNFLIKPLQKIESFVAKFIGFFISLIYLLLKLPFNLGYWIMNLVQKAVRYLVWLNVKSIVSWINFVYKTLAFFRINSLVRLCELIAKNYFREYSAINFDRQDQNLSRLSLIMRKRQHQLISVDKFQKKIKTPTFFLRKQNQQSSEEPIQIHQNIQGENVNLVREGPDDSNSLLSEERNISPKLVGISRSHERIKRPEAQSSNPNLSGGVTVQIPRRNVNVNEDRRNFPDRDISPDKYMKPIPRIGQLSQPNQSRQQNVYRPMVHSKQAYEQELRNYNNLIDTDDVRQTDQNSTKERNKKQLEEELFNLRQKIENLISDNNQYIKQLQHWVKQKSQTIMMTRKQNIELLQEIQQLQKQNIRKSEKFTDLQKKVHELEEMLDKQKVERGGLNFQVQKLQEEIQEKTRQIMRLKERIKSNFEHLQEMEHLFESQSLEKSQGKQRYSEAQNYRLITAQKKDKQQNEGSRVNESTIDQKDEEREDDHPLTIDELRQLNMLEKLRQAEEKTVRLEDRVKKVLEEERKMVENRDAELMRSVQKQMKTSLLSEQKSNLIFPSENLPYPELQQSKRQNFESSKNLKDTNDLTDLQKSKKSPKVIRNDGKSKITMTFE